VQEIAGVAEIVIDRDGLDDAGDGFGPESRDASGHHGMAVGQVLAQLVIERASAFCGGIHGLPRSKKLFGECSGRHRERPEL
jgi:hypothetical protein